MKSIKCMVLGLLLVAVTLSLSITGVTSDEVELVWAGWGKEEATMAPLFEWIIETWNQQHEGVAHIKWLGWPWAETQKQLILMVKAGNPPDVAQINNPWLNSLTTLGALADINEIIDPNWIRETYVESALLSGRVGDKQYMLPWAVYSIGILYNPRLLRQAGYPIPPNTIEQFEGCLAALKAIDPEIIPYAAMTKAANTMASDSQQWVWAFGGRIFDEQGNVVLNSSAGVKALEWLKRLLDKGYIVLDMDRFDARTLFTLGKVGFYDDALSVFEYLRGMTEYTVEEFSKMIYPMYRSVLKYGDKPQATSSGYSLAIFEASEHKDLAADLVTYITGVFDVVLKAYQEHGLLPGMKEVMESPIVQRNAWDRTHLQICEYASPNELIAYPQYAQLQDILADAIKATLIGLKPAQKALDDAASELEAALGH